MRGRCLLLALLIAGPVVAGCTLVSSFDGLQGGPRPGENPSDGSAQDAGQDGASSTQEASTDGADHTDAQASDGGADVSNRSDARTSDGASDVPVQPDAQTSDAGSDASSDAPDAAISDASTPDQSSPVDAPSDVSIPDGTPSDGGCVPELIVSGIGEPRGITVTSGKLYWVQVSPVVSIWSLSVGAGSDGATKQRVDIEPGDNLRDPFDVAVDAQYMYWTEHSGTFLKRRLSGGSVSAFTGSGQCSYIAVSGGLAYVTDETSAVVWGGNGGGLLYSTQGPTTGVGVLGSSLYWAHKPSTDWEIVTGPLAVGTVNAVWTQRADAGARVTAIDGLAVDTDNLYWIADHKRLLRTRYNTSGETTTLYEATTAFGMGDVAVEGDWVYWSERDAGNIWRICRDAPGK